MIKNKNEFYWLPETWGKFYDKHKFEDIDVLVKFALAGGFVLIMSNLSYFVPIMVFLTAFCMLMSCLRRRWNENNIA